MTLLLKKSSSITLSNKENPTSTLKSSLLDMLNSERHLLRSKLTIALPRRHIDRELTFYLIGLKKKENHSSLSNSIKLKKSNRSSTLLKSWIDLIIMIIRKL